MKHSLAFPGRVLVLLSALAIAAQASAQAPSKPVDPVGDFEYSTTVNNQTVNGVISIAKKDNVLSGKILSDMMPEIPITAVKIEGKTVTISAKVPDAEGDLVIVLTFEDDSKFSGTWSLAGDGGSISGKRKAS
ncbi:MAG: hypothetical protein ACRENP_16910 [Longimicrobiales bacterium]